MDKKKKKTTNNKTCAQRKKSCANVKQNDASISCGASPRCSIYWNIGVRKIRIENKRFSMTNEQNIILEEAYISTTVHNFFRKNLSWR